MPLRSVKMKRFIFGFQRRVWCPKWTPLSSSSRMVTTAMVDSSSGRTGPAAGGPFLVDAPPVGGALTPVPREPTCEQDQDRARRSVDERRHDGDGRANFTSEDVMGSV
ncbi:hypothetical protein GCM10008944_29110 [Cytobacillus oceanisediminis]